MSPNCVSSQHCQVYIIIIAVSPSKAAYTQRQDVTVTVGRVSSDANGATTARRAHALVATQPYYLLGLLTCSCSYLLVVSRGTIVDDEYDDGRK